MLIENFTLLYFFYNLFLYRSKFNKPLVIHFLIILFFELIFIKFLDFSIVKNILLRNKSIK